MFVSCSCKIILYISLYSDFTTLSQATRSKACQSVLGLNSRINESFVMWGMETSKELVKMLLVLLHGTFFSESPPEYFTRPGVTRISSLARTALNIPVSHRYFLLFFYLIWKKWDIPALTLSHCLGMHCFAAGDGDSGIGLWCDTSNLFYCEIRLSMLCIALNVS